MLTNLYWQLYSHYQRLLPNNQYRPVIDRAIRIVFIGITFMIIRMIYASITHAQIPLQDPLQTEGAAVGATYRITELSTVLTGIIQYFVIIAGIIMFLCVIISGLQWMLSRGEPQGIETARGRLTGCLIGLTIVMLAYAVMLIIEYFFGVNIIRPQTITP